MATLAEIASGYGVEPIEFAVAIGLADADPYSELGPERTAQVINVADESDFFGLIRNGRHRLR